ncbi:MAG: hypothetical protein JWM53_2172 [bacterium]|nr:hypothetical protein [bacterium]
MTLQRPIKNTLRIRIDEAGLSAVWKRVRERRLARRRFRGFALAAGVALAAGLFFWLRHAHFPAHVEPLRVVDGQPLRTLEAGPDPRVVELSDGSRIVLSPGARLVTVDNEAHVFRTTLVRGRAEFEVRPGGPRQWLVHAGAATVEVVGTHFIVTRASGSVSIQVTRGEVLVRGQQVEDGARRLAVGESLRVDDVSSPGADPEKPVAPSPTGSEPKSPSVVYSNPPVPNQIGIERIAGADPHLPDAVKRRLRGRPDTSFIARICVDKRGTVSDVAVVQGIDGADKSLVAALRQWRYEPQPVPLCFVTQLVFSIE